MIEAAENAQRFVAGKSRADLDTDPMLLFALVRAIEIIGEAASKVSAEQRAVSATVPWIAIAAMRNRLIHAYFDIDRDIVWKTVTEEVPSLRSELQQLLPKEPTV
ncbi:MAG: HepT-like ribonuclease domain-containing protein [Steroidobacteraceae bacterium]